MIEIERALAVDAFVAAVAAIVHHLAVARTIRFYQYIAVDEGFPVVRVIDHGSRILAIHQIKLPVAGLDPVVAHHQPRRPVLEVVAFGPVSQRPQVVVLIDDAQG